MPITRRVAKPPSGAGHGSASGASRGQQMQMRQRNSRSQRDASGSGSSESGPGGAGGAETWTGAMQQPRVGEEQTMTEQQMLEIENQVMRARLSELEAHVERLESVVQPAGEGGPGSATATRPTPIEISNAGGAGRGDTDPETGVELDELHNLILQIQDAKAQALLYKLSDRAKMADDIRYLHGLLGKTRHERAEQVQHIRELRTTVETLHQALDKERRLRHAEARAFEHVIEKNQELFEQRLVASEDRVAARAATLRAWLQFSKEVLPATSGKKPQQEQDTNANTSAPPESNSSDEASHVDTQPSLTKRQRVLLARLRKRSAAQSSTRWVTEDVLGDVAEEEQEEEQEDDANTRANNHSGDNNNARSGHPPAGASVPPVSEHRSPKHVTPQERNRPAQNQPPPQQQQQQQQQQRNQEQPDPQAHSEGESGAATAATAVPARSSPATDDYGQHDFEFDADGDANDDDDDVDDVDDSVEDDYGGDDDDEDITTEEEEEDDGDAQSSVTSSPSMLETRTASDQDTPGNGSRQTASESVRSDAQTERLLEHAVEFDS